ncbi:heavy metal translocating P-type ATPase [Desulfonatronovibrio hydrogenovorans]|uniref:heavy metal translocating P-type ATPase n=1 Tax=Desulfonatronovibrio hydrogenovorans TaxID=53245 RepID=UPI00048E1E3B|nr:cation-translocating P-type ATPase [Desulfonatronovibrio hydrogenovorans]
MIGRFSNLGVYQELLTTRKFYVTLSGGLAALAGYLWQGQGWTPELVSILLVLASVGVNGFPIIIGAVKGLLKRQVNVDELVSLAIVACLVQGEYLTAAVVAFIMTLGALVEEVTSDCARRSIHRLAAVTPQEATLVQGEKEVRVAVDKLRPGDQLLVKPGERIPVDARIIQGKTMVDESAITGESVPGMKQEGDQVMAGTLNHNGVVVIEALKVGRDTMLGRIIRLVERAEAHKPRATRFIDRYAGWFTPLILTIAGLTWFFSGEISRAVAVLIAGCPCALIMAAPTATVAAVGRLASSGVLVKAGVYLEELAASDVILFDKTGTLTRGEPRVSQVALGKKYSRDDILGLAACVEKDCTHPLARAVVKAAHYAGVRVQKAREVLSEIGLGIRAVLLDNRLVEVGSPYMNGGTAALPPLFQEKISLIRDSGATPLVVYLDKDAVGLISVRDELRPGIRGVISDLERLGMGRTGILSGDHEKAVATIARDSGIKSFWWELKPDRKLGIIEDFQNKGHKVTFVGDGINDAPALAKADIGIAMGEKGTDVALETADIALVRDDLSTLPVIVSMGRRMVRLIKINVFLGVGFNFLAVWGSAAGFLSPIQAAVFHNIGSVIVVLSSASLAFARFKRSSHGTG